MENDWNRHKGANFSKIAKKSLSSYISINDIFKEIERVSKKEEILQSDFEYLKNLLEQRIKLYSSLEFKAEIYKQAIVKIDKTKDRFEKDESFSLEDVGNYLLCDFLIAYNHTIFEEDEILQEIGEIGASLEIGNADSEDWQRVTGELRDKLLGFVQLNEK
ncbi:MAG: hypothetical protein Q4A27_00745 [bacterium]|nr:hypothetical protein [bacterium]